MKIKLKKNVNNNLIEIKILYITKRKLTKIESILFSILMLHKNYLTKIKVDNLKYNIRKNNKLGSILKIKEKKIIENNIIKLEKLKKIKNINKNYYNMNIIPYYPEILFLKIRIIVWGEIKKERKV